MRVENLAEDQSMLANCIKTFDDLKSKAKWRESFAFGLRLLWNGEIPSYVFLYFSL